MSSTLAAHEQPVSRIFSNDYVFTIPPYQRPYAWTNEQAGELFDDLVSFMTARPGGVESMPPYFLGSIVLIKSVNAPDAEVIDGQQRLTTLTLLLAAIRNCVGNEASDITQLIYEKGSQILGTHDRFRLSLRERDRDFFKRFVQREDGIQKLLDLVDPASDSQRNLRDNARLFVSRLMTLPETERLRIAKFVVTRCYLVVVSTPDLNSAYRIFSVLNTRGLDLSATDILKAEVIGGISETYRSEYTKKWEDTEEALGREAFGELFSHIRMVFRKVKPQGTLLVEFREHVLKGKQPKDFVDDILAPMAEVYEELVDENFSGSSVAQEVNERLKWLNKLEFNDWLPPALAFSVRYRNRLDEISRFLSNLERLAYSLLLIRSGVNERIDRFSRLTKAIESEEDLFSAQSPLQVSASEQYQAYSVLSGPFYQTLSARARSLILLRLDALVSGGGASYNYSVVTVEHVLPQLPPSNSEWIDWFPDEAVRDAAVHCLGNLALLTRKKNSSASNFDFAHKKNVYFTKGGVSPFALTTQVVRHLDWTPAVVNARQSELLDILEHHWSLHDRKMPPADRVPQANLHADGSWRSDVFEALRRLGGKGALLQIYKEVEAIRKASGRTSPSSLDAIVRRTLEENSSETNSFKGNYDLFTMPDGKGAGVWAIRNQASLNAP